MCRARPLMRLRPCGFSLCLRVPDSKLRTRPACSSRMTWRLTAGLAFDLGCPSAGTWRVATPGHMPRPCAHAARPRRVFVCSRSAFAPSSMVAELLGGTVGLYDQGPETVFWFELPLLQPPPNRKSEDERRLEYSAQQQVRGARPLLAAPVTSCLPLPHAAHVAPPASTPRPRRSFAACKRTCRLTSRSPTARSLCRQCQHHSSRGRRPRIGWSTSRLHVTRRRRRRPWTHGRTCRAAHCAAAAPPGPPPPPQQAQLAGTGPQRPRVAGRAETVAPREHSRARVCRRSRCLRRRRPACARPTATDAARVRRLRCRG